MEFVGDEVPVLGAVLRHEVLELGVLGWPPVASRVPTAAAAMAMAMALCLSLMERRQSRHWWSRAEETSHLMSHLRSQTESRGVLQVQKAALYASSLALAVAPTQQQNA